MKSRKILLIIAGIFAVIAFLGIFLSALEIKMFGLSSVSSASQVYFAKNGGNVTVLPVIGFGLILIAGILFFLKAAGKADSKITDIIALVLAVAGTVLVFLTKAAYGKTNDILDVYYNQMRLSTGPLLGGICGSVSALAALIACFLKKE